MDAETGALVQTPSPRGHGSGRALRTVGVVVFLVGLAVFTGSLVVGHYRLSEEALAALTGPLPAETVTALQPLAGRTYTSKPAFLRDVDRLVNPDGNVSSYQMDQYRMAVVRAALTGVVRRYAGWFLLGGIGLAALGGLLAGLAGLHRLPGIANDGTYHRSISSRGVLGIAAGVYLIGFYVILYWLPAYATELFVLLDPVSQALRGAPADRWFTYGSLYTCVVAVMGVRMLVRYRHSRYHLVRTLSVMAFQFGFAWLLPAIMERLHRPSMDLKNAWPLNYSFFADWHLNSLLGGGSFGVLLLVWGILLSVVAVPVLAYLFGKRWYCSWVCGCGGLAETLGDPFRQLSSKSLRAWRIERILIHSVLVFAVVMTAMQLANYLSAGSWFGDSTWRVNQWYSFLIGSLFAGVVGTGFYPLMGSRVWCRFGCPLAAILGIVQKWKSRFVITTNGGQCISCGNCSTYCEMGIDVRWYAQRGQNTVRASCVGCGVCAAVCPRGVLRLETVPSQARRNTVLDDELIAARD